MQIQRAAWKAKKNPPAGGGGEGGGAGGEGGDGDPPEYVKAEDLDAKLNAVVSTHLKRFQGQLAKTVETMIANAIPKPPDTEPDPKGAGGGAGGDDVKAQIKALQDRLERSEKARQAAEDAQKAAETRRTRDEERSALAGALRDAGVTNPLQLKAAQALLESEGVIARGEDGAVGYKTKDKYGNDAIVPLAEGIGAWAKADGKVFLPPTSARGSGAAGGKPGGKPGAAGAKDAAARAAEAAQEAKRALVAAVMGGGDEE